MSKHVYDSVAPNHNNTIAPSTETETTAGSTAAPLLASATTSAHPTAKTTTTTTPIIATTTVAPNSLLVTTTSTATDATSASSDSATDSPSTAVTSRAALAPLNPKPIAIETTTLLSSSSSSSTSSSSAAVSAGRRTTRTASSSDQHPNSGNCADTTSAEAHQPPQLVAAASLDHRKCVSGADSLHTADNHQYEDQALNDGHHVQTTEASAELNSEAPNEWLQSGCSVHQQQHHSSSSSAAPGGGCGGGGGGNGGGGGSDAWSRLNETQLRELISEMAKKLEYTERMNWLCLTNRPMGPPHRKTSLPNHKEVKVRFLQICDQTLSDEVKAALRLPTFDSYEWSDEAVLHLMQTMFVDCGFVDKFQIPLPVLREWLYEVYKHYNLVPFHNFRHCFCVAQMMYSMAWHTNLMARLGDLEVLILLVSCICHDLDHPGYNNIYQINARTELALRYNDISPLENHHCSIAFRLLEHPDCNIFKNFSKDTFREIREGIIRCILATDMARHNDILVQFQEILPQFDYTNQGHINVFCMILIKVADISNESRPMNIAEPWLERLFQEFFAQSAIEKAEGLPVTPFMDPDKVSKPGSQVRFIGLVLLPLFESLGQLLPELNELIIHPVQVAFDYYKCLNDAQIRPRKSHVDPDDLSDGGTGSASGTASAGTGGPMPRSQSGVSLRSRRSMPSQKSVSKNSVDEPMCISAELHDLPEGSESGDSETATEVEVAEKTSKFKINSEGTRNANTNNNISNNNKCTRKESRRKRPSMISEMYTSSFGGRPRGSYGNILGQPHHSSRGHFGSSRALSLDQYNSRRLSDGVQAIVSDENSIRFNRQHRSMDNEVTGSQMSDKFMSLDSCGNGGSGSGVNKVTPLGSGGIHSKSSSSGSSKSAKLASAKNGAARSFMSTLRQLKESFNFSFEKDLKKRVAGQNIVASCCNANAAATVKNNNPDVMKPTSGFCCGSAGAGGAGTTTVFGSPYAKDEMTPHARRNRACSLDVPVRMWYHGSPGGDADSRKSSHDDNHSNRTPIMGDPGHKCDCDGNRSDGTTSI